MKQPHERGELGAWLVEQRKRLSEERGKRVTQQVVVTEMSDRGYPIDDSYYRALESGAKTTAGHAIREAFADYFGRTPPSPSRSSGGADAELIETIRAQTVAINELVAILRAQAQVPPDDERAVQAMVEALRRGARLVVEPPPPQPGTTP